MRFLTTFGMTGFATPEITNCISSSLILIDHERNPLLNRHFQIIDVFHDQPFSGNPLAVVLDAEGLSTADMQRVTRWLNLSETAFLLPPTTASADYRVRIFTLQREMPFAGHPTLGSCHAWLTSGGKPHNDGDIIQECGAGLVPIHRSETNLAFAAPPLIRSGQVDASKVQEIADFLRIDVSQIVDSQWADNGPGWIVVLLESAEAVRALNPPKDSPHHIDIGVVGPYSRVVQRRSSFAPFLVITWAAWLKTR